MKASLFLLRTIPSVLKTANQLKNSSILLIRGFSTESELKKVSKKVDKKSDKKGDINKGKGEKSENQDHLITFYETAMKISE